MLSKVEKNLQCLIEQAPIETSYLLLSDLYLIKAKTLKDAEAYAQSRRILERTDLFVTEEGLRLAQLKSAEAAPAYQERNSLYEHLTNDPQSHLFSAIVWFMKGLNDIQEGRLCQNVKESNNAYRHFDQAALAFHQASQIALHAQPELAIHATKHEALSYACHPDRAHDAWNILQNLISNPALFSKIKAPEEIYHMAGRTALHLTSRDVLEKGRELLNWVKRSVVQALGRKVP